MFGIVKNLATHSGRLERWLGAETVEHLSQSMASWYGPPIGIAGVPGAVWACKGGDFRGRIGAGQLSNAIDYSVNRLAKHFRRAALAQRSKCSTGFASLSDLIAEATAGKRQVFPFFKIGSTGVVGVTNSLFGVGSSPAAGANASNAPGGNALTSATVGAFPFTNPGGSDTLHFTVAFPWASVANTLLLYDRLFHVNKTMASTATEAVTGVPTRYQSTTPGDADYVAGNFLFVEVGGTALAATAHNWTVCTYTDQGGAASTLPSLVGNSGAIVRRLDHPIGQWFAPLETGDTGIRALTQMQSSASVATGVINFVIGHPIAFMPIPVANTMCVIDGINTAFSLTRIFNDAALAFLEINKPNSAGTSYAGMFEAVAG